MTQFILKIIALVAMVLDHSAKTALATGVLKPYLGIAGNQALLVTMKVLGRMAFPIFAWFTAESCRKTSNMGKYLLRLGIFAVLSEAPFQLNFYGGVSPACHNVIFTMLLAALAVYAGRRLNDFISSPWAQWIPAGIAICLGWFLRTDYNAWGVALILGLYYLPTERGRLAYLGTWGTVFQLVWHSWNGHSLSWLHSAGRIQLLYWLGILAAVALLATYNGQRGRKSKWLFYWFYPGHLMLLYGLTRWIAM